MSSKSRLASSVERLSLLIAALTNRNIGLKAVKTAAASPISGVCGKSTRPSRYVM